MSDALLAVKVESSILPPISVDTGGSGEGAAPSTPTEPGIVARLRAALVEGFLSFARPRVTVSSPLMPTPKVIEKWGAPWPWPVGLALVLVVLVMPAGLLVWWIVRRLVRKAGIDA